MARLLRVLCSVGVVLLQSLNAHAGESPDPARPVLVQKIDDNILWTRRPERYTLQVITTWRLIPGTKATVSSPAVAARRQMPSVEVWLLRKDGAAIAPIQRWQTPTPKPSISLPGNVRPEVLYAYPKSEGAEAVAVAVCVDGECLAKKIVPFAD